MVTPPPMRGRDNILWIQSMVSPLKTINDAFQVFAREKKIEASVTSVVIHFEWYLNYKFSKYFTNQNDKITLAHYGDLGVPVFDDGETGEIPDLVWGENEDWSLAPEDEKPNPYYDEFESLAAIGASFKVLVPEVSILHHQFDIMLRAEIDKYRLSGKTYNIEHNL